MTVVVGMRWRKTVVAVAVVLGAVTHAAPVLGDASPAPPRIGPQIGPPGDTLFDAWLRPAPPAPSSASWLRFGGQKTRAPKLNRSEAGVTVDLGRRVAVQLHYARTATAPTMHRDHDDGILTRLRVTF